jgi:hypothetical protein
MSERLFPYTLGGIPALFQRWLDETVRRINTPNQTLELPDGITAPDTVTGKAVIYVDAADGDLKVKFSDGTVKTIVTDT